LSQKGAAKPVTFSGEHKTLVRYFLGELPPKEQEQVEERYMLDHVYAEMRDEVETNLVDAYVARTLTAEQRKHFETRFMITPARREAVEAAYLLCLYYKRIVASEGQPSPSLIAAKMSKRGLTLPRALAAGLVIALLGSVLTWFVLQWHFVSPEKTKASLEQLSPAPPQQTLPVQQQTERPSLQIAAEPKRQVVARSVPDAQSTNETARKGTKFAVKPTSPEHPELPLQSPKNASNTPGLSRAPRVAIAQVVTRRVDDSLSEPQKNSIHSEVYRQLIASFDASGIAAASTAESTYTLSLQITTIRTLEAETQMVIHFSLNDTKTGVVIYEGDITGKVHDPEQPGSLRGPNAIGGIGGGHLGSIPPLIRAASDACIKLAAVVKEQLQPK
jgi:hypothetical protein